MRAGVIALFTIAACSGGAGGGGNTDAGVDASPPCGPDLCTAISASCGTTVDSCGGTVDCGSCQWTTESVASGERPALAIDGDTVDVAFVGVGPLFELSVAQRGPSGWVGDPVFELDGEPGGPIDLAVAGDGTRYLTFVDAQSQLRIAIEPPGGGWSVSDPIGGGVAAAVAIDPDGAPVLAAAGVIGATTGLFVLTSDGAGGWSATAIDDPSSSGAPHSLALAVDRDAVAVAWRDDADQVIRFASGRGSAFATEIIDPAAPPATDDGALSLAFDDGGRPDVLYGAGGILRHAVRAAGAWHSSPLPLDGADGDDALASGAGLHGAVFATGGLKVLDAIAGVWLVQTVAGPCDHGTVDLAVGTGGAVHVADACAGAIEYHARAALP